MAFFGLTQLGAQNQFQSALLDAMDLTLFTDEEFRKAFLKLDKDGSGYLEISELSALLEVVYRGPAPPSQVAALMEEFDSNHDGRVSLDEFVAGVAAIKRRLESGAKPRAAAAASSFSELKESRRRHVRPELEPKSVLAKPLTTSMETGWAPRDTLPPQTTTGRVKCPETKYAEELLKAGVFY